MKTKKFTFKIIISLLLISYLIFWISWEEIVRTLSNTNYVFLLAVFPLVFIALLIRTVKWGVILKSLGIDVKTPKRLRTVLVGLFYGLFTPAKAGEVGRVYFLKHDKTKTIPTVIWDKAIDALALVTLSILTVAIFFRDPQIAFIIGIMAVLIVVVLFVALNKSLTMLVLSLFSISEKYSKAYFSNMVKIGKNKKAVLHAYLLGLLYYGVGFVIGGIVLKAIDPRLSLILVFSMPLIILFGNAPITISGLGLREFIATITFTLFSVHSSYGFSFSILLFLIMTFIPGIVGYLVTVSDDKRVSLENIPGNYFDKHNSKNPVVQFMMDSFHKDLNNFVKKTSSKTLLDIGCGEGFTTRIMQKANKKIKIHAADIEPVVIKKAKELNKSITFSVRSVYDLKFKKDSFDTVVASEMLEHLEFPDKAIKEMRRVAKNYCILSVPHEPYWRIVNVLRGSYLSELGNTPGHLQNFTTSDLKKKLMKHFKEVEIKHSMLWNIALCKK